MSFTLQQNQLLSPLLGDEEITGLFSVEADLAAMQSFEVALAIAQAKEGFISREAAQTIEENIGQFKPNYEKLGLGMARDGISVPALVTQLKEQVNPNIHFGATSQDAIDTSFMLRGKAAFLILLSRLENIFEHLDTLDATFGTNKLMARTRMQAALQFTVADRISTWSTGIRESVASLKSCRFPVQFGGPIGLLIEFGDRSYALKADLAERLGLEVQEQNWHASRGNIVAMANACSHITGALGKFGIDFCLMAQDDFSELKFTGSGTSSVMKHKQNPIQAEALVTLARFNATLVSGVHQSLVHEQERSGAAWTLEWMLLPQMIVAAGASTRIAIQLLNDTTAIGLEP